MFGSSSFAGASTSALGAARPGDHFAASLQRGREHLSVFHVLEGASTTSSWAGASELDAVAQRVDGLVTDAQRQRAVALELRRVRRRTALQTVRKGGSGAIEDG